MIAAVIPAYQAAGLVGPVVAGLAGLAAPVLVVDDGSSDGTGREAAAAGARVLTHPRNRGKGAALRTGIEAALQAGADRIATLDADGQHDPADLPGLIAGMDRSGAAMVIGSRLGDLALTPGYRQRANRLGNAVLARWLGVPLEDVQSGYRLYRADLLRQIAIRSDGFAADTEILIRAVRAGARPAIVPVRTIYRPDERRISHFRPVPDTTRVAWTALKVLLGLY